MERMPVKSALLKSVGYDAASQTLELEIVTHRPKNVVYTYSPFSPERYAKFMAAESKGKFFLREIKPDKTLPYKKVGETDAKKEEAPEAPPETTPPKAA
jgi:KTSC domain